MEETDKITVGAGEHMGRTRFVRATMDRWIGARRQHHHGAGHTGIAQLVHERSAIMRAEMVVGQNPVWFNRMNPLQRIVRRKALDDGTTRKSSFQRVLSEKATIIVVIQHEKCELRIHEWHYAYRMLNRCGKVAFRSRKSLPDELRGDVK
jgi:hypothetical protein